MKNKKSILVLVRDDASSTKTWSGIPFHIIRILRDYGHEVEVLDNLGFPRSFYWRFRNYAGKLFPSLLPKYYSEISSKYYGEKVNKFLAKSTKSYDFILVVDFLEGILNVDTSIPILVYRDASYALLNKLHYPGFESFDEKALRLLLDLESKCLKKVDKMLLTSDWAIKETKSFYPEIKGDKFFCQPFSSQLYPPPEKSEWKLRRIDEQSSVKFLFVGRDWKRKGGDDTISIITELHRMGVNVHLTVVGYKLKPNNLPFSCDVIENLDVSLDSDFERLKNLYLCSHFFILPTKVEAFGIVFSEAMSLGLPVVTRSVCATPEILHDRVEGFLIKEGQSFYSVAQNLAELIKDQPRYEEMQKNASKRFTERFHPKLWVDRLIEISEKNL